MNDPHLSLTVRNGDDVLGYVAIDSTLGGRACGGLRMVADVDAAEIDGLARAMTLKFGYLGLPQGGAKAGVRGDPEAPLEDRRRRLAAFGEAIAPLLRPRVYAPFSDMGTDNADIRHMLRAAGVHVKRRELRGRDSGYYTALSVLAGIRQGARRLGLDLAQAAVAIEGFGKVGAALGGLLASARVRVVAISTSRGAIYNARGLDMPRILALAAEAGSRSIEAYRDADRLDRTALLELPVDVLCPCARHDTLHGGNAARVAARLVSPGANNPVTPEAERVLEARSILCLPYFVTNCGGALGGTMEFAGHGKRAIEALIDRHLGARIARLLEEAERRATPARVLAEEESRRRFAAMQQAAENPTPAARLMGIGLEAHRRGWVPAGLMRAASLRYFVQRADPRA